ncbi:MAG: hypothetical protein J3R72DRAFT_527748 [Linnemannia gamsii]|nr:MAG: hypothetical protein J3R72DRAFT_527748 [Linnemannia gamsii]
MVFDIDTVGWPVLLVFDAGVIFYHDDQTSISRPFTVKDPILGYPKRGPIDLIAGYAILIYAVPTLYQFYNPRFFRHHPTMLRVLYVLSIVLSFVYYVGSCLDTSGDKGFWYWLCLIFGAVSQAFSRSIIALMDIETITSSDTDEENVDEKQQFSYA